MDVFKSWLVANIEGILIIFTVLMLMAAGFILIPKFVNEGNDYYMVSFILMLLFSGILCTTIVFCIRNGFLSLVVLASIIGLVALGSVKESNSEEAQSQTEVVTQSLIDSESETNEFEIITSKVFEKLSWFWVIIISIGALAFGLFTSVYANRNFDDVVSRRFLYRNSDVSVFEYRWKYTFNRLYAGFMTVFAIGVQLLLFFTFLSALK